jgi:hypothetical protein
MYQSRIFMIFPPDALPPRPPTSAWRAALAIDEFITAWQGLLRFGFYCLRQTIMRLTFGISELQKAKYVRRAGGALLGGSDGKARGGATAVEPAVSFQIRSMAFSCLATMLQARTVQNGVL